MTVLPAARQADRIRLTGPAVTAVLPALVPCPVCLRASASGPYHAQHL